MQPQIFNQAVFLDKDGTVLENVPYNVDPSLMTLTEGAGEGLRKLQQAGYMLFVISNQSGVAQGKFSEEALKPVHEQLKKMLAKEGVTLHGFYYCPHHPKGRVSQYSITCFCRKPNPGLLFQAAREHNLNLSASWFIGDILNDVECGRRAECRTVLINNGNETEWQLGPLRQPHFTVSNLLYAANVILENTQVKPAPKTYKARRHTRSHTSSRSSSRLSV